MWLNVVKSLFGFSACLPEKDGSKAIDPNPPRKYKEPVTTNGNLNPPNYKIQRNK